MKKDLERALRHERLGENFYFGYTVKTDLELARKHFCLAALYGEGEIKAEALCNLALLTSEPYAKLALYAQAAEEDCADAINMIGVCFERTFGEDDKKPGQVEKARSEAIRWYREAARAGSVDGMYNYALRTNSTTKRNQYLEKAAWRGHTQSIQTLEKIWRRNERNDGVPSHTRSILKPYLDAAQEWEEQPVVILRVSTPEMLEAYQDLRYRYNRKQLVFDVAVALQRSVILLFNNRDDAEMLSCEGYDLERAGLTDAMDNKYTFQDHLKFGKFMLVKIRAEDQEPFCAEVVNFLNNLIEIPF